MATTEWLRLIAESTADTVTTVTLPVAALLWLLAWLEASGRFDPHRFLGRAGRWQPVYAAAIAAVPGCAGGIAVSRLFVDGVVGSAALWAAHIATAGDASFVLLVGRPLAALGLFAVLFLLGAAVGVALAAVRHTPLPPPVAGGEVCAAEVATPGEVGQVPPVVFVFFGLVVATVLAALVGDVAPGGAVMGVTGALAAGAIVAALVVQRDDRCGCELAGPAGDGRTSVLAATHQTAKDAAEITLWVAVADLAFYTLEHLWGARFGAWLSGAVLPVTLLSVAVGMIPGCGPQIFLARLYTAGSLPFVAILANAVSQHGDAIFPLLARQRGKAVQVTVASALLAAVVGAAVLVFHAR